MEGRAASGACSRGAEGWVMRGGAGARTVIFIKETFMIFPTLKFSQCFSFNSFSSKHMTFCIFSSLTLFFRNKFSKKSLRPVTIRMMVNGKKIPGIPFDIEI